jgi:N-acetylglutamate synthase-like GNAT family acetyltransferase
LIEIVNVKEYPGGIEEAVRYIHGKWGSAENYDFYYDAVLHSSEPGKALPKFFLLLKDGRITGCYGLITNDFVSRHDLYPWFACLYVEEEERGQQLGRLMMEHAAKEAGESGFSMMYLVTDHEGYYEKYGWRRIEDGYDHKGTSARIYEMAL